MTTINITEEILAGCGNAFDALRNAVCDVLKRGATAFVCGLNVTILLDPFDGACNVALPPAAREWLDLSCTIDADEVDPISFVLDIPALFLSTPVRMAA